MSEHARLTPEQIIAIEARWAGVQYTAPQTDDEGYLHVALDSGHSVGWDIEGAGGCCKTHLVRIAAAPTDIAALLAQVAALETELARYEALEAAARELCEDDLFVPALDLRRSRAKVAEWCASWPIDDSPDEIAAVSVTLLRYIDEKANKRAALAAALASLEGVDGE